MKKKIWYAAIAAGLLLWFTSDYNPAQLIISFIAAGAVPGMDYSINPFVMVMLALVTGGAVAFKLFTPFEIRFDEQPEAPKTRTQNSKKKQSSKSKRRNLSRAASLAK